jgi:hypothetical protein
MYDFNIEDPMKRDKVVTEASKQLIDEENKNVVGKRPRGRPKKIQGSGLIPFFDPIAKKLDEYAKRKQKERLALARQTRPTTVPVVASAPAVGSGKRGRPKGSKNKK